MNWDFHLWTFLGFVKNGYKPGKNAPKTDKVSELSESTFPQKHNFGVKVKRSML